MENSVGNNGPRAWPTMGSPSANQCCLRFPPLPFPFLLLIQKEPLVQRLFYTEDTKTRTQSSLCVSCEPCLHFWVGVLILRPIEHAIELIFALEIHRRSIVSNLHDKKRFIDTGL